MRLDFTEEQEALRDAARTMLGRECPMSTVRAVVEGTGDADGLWAQIVALGWPALTIPEAFGGLGLGAVELAVVVEELGRVTAPGPFLPTVTQFAPAVRAVGSEEQQRRFLGGVATGAITGSLAMAEPGTAFDPAAVRAHAEPGGGVVVLRGAKDMVIEAGVVDELVVVARRPGSERDDGVGAYVVARATPGVRVEPVVALDPSRTLGRVVLDGVTVPPDRVLGEPGPDCAAALRGAADHASVALAVETVGIGQTMFDATLAHAKDREQFGVPIGSFQAIKHKFADMLVALERARATAYFAALALSEDDRRAPLATAHAKAAAGDGARLLAKEGIQIHGGIGYTWEHDMHLWVRRARSNALLGGTTAEHRDRVATLIGLPRD